MPGAIAIVLVLVLMPVLVCMGSVILAMALGEAMNRDSEVRHTGSELLDLNV